MGEATLEARTKVALAARLAETARAHACPERHARPGRHSLNGATIAFDLDGTLVDTAPDLVASLNIILAEEGLPPCRSTTCARWSGRGAKAPAGARLRGRRRAAGRGRAGPRPGRALHRPLPRPHRPRERALPRRGRRPWIALAAAGAKLAVCTNKLTHLPVALLDALDLTRHFDAVVGADSAPAAKPDPRHVLATIAAVGGDPARAVMVGDSINDALAAKAANVPDPAGDVRLHRGSSRDPGRRSVDR